MQKDVIANTDNSVDILKHRSDETYLCPALTSYVTPLRAVNVEGKWRVIVNGVKAHYETLSQGRRNPFHEIVMFRECKKLAMLAGGSQSSHRKGKLDFDTSTT